MVLRQGPGARGEGRSPANPAASDPKSPRAHRSGPSAPSGQSRRRGTICSSVALVQVRDEVVDAGPIQHQAELGRPAFGEVDRHHGKVGLTEMDSVPSSPGRAPQPPCRSRHRVQAHPVWGPGRLHARGHQLQGRPPPLRVVIRQALYDWSIGRRSLSSIAIGRHPYLQRRGGKRRWSSDARNGRHRSSASTLVSTGRLPRPACPFDLVSSQPEMACAGIVVDADGGPKRRTASANGQGPMRRDARHQGDRQAVVLTARALEGCPLGELLRPDDVDGASRILGDQVHRCHEGDFREMRFGALFGLPKAFKSSPEVDHSCAQVMPRNNGRSPAIRVSSFVQKQVGRGGR